ncbi:MAG: transporter [Blastocatellales bacterium]
MTEFMRPLLVVIALAALTTIGDYCLKRASQQIEIFNLWLASGWLIYGTTAVGWVWTMRYLKLATLGAVFSVCMVLFMALLGFLIFKETLSKLEIIGIMLALISVAMLARYSE